MLALFPTDKFLAELQVYCSFKGTVAMQDKNYE